MSLPSAPARADEEGMRGAFLHTRPMDNYLTLSSPGEATYVEKRSRFLAFARHVGSEEEVKSIVEQYRREYYDARHVCYAYALGTEGERFRAVDDGEPGGSAGKPIHGQIVSRGLTETLVVVVRYFGGVKLGTGGLAVAYKTAAGSALDAAATEERILTSEVKAQVPYPDADAAMRLARGVGAEMLPPDYTDVATILRFRIRQSEEPALIAALQKIHTLTVLSEE